MQQQMLENEKSIKVKTWGYEMESKYENFEQVKEELGQAIIKVKHSVAGVMTRFWKRGHREFKKISPTMVGQWREFWNLQALKQP